MGAFELPALEPVPATTHAEAGGIALAVVEEAVAEAAAIREAAHREGLAAGRAEARGEVEDALAALREAAAGVAAERDLVAAQAEPALAELALAGAEQVVGGALAVRPELVVDALRGALRQLLERHRISVQVNPDDLALVREALGGVVDELGGVDHCDVQAERRVRRGGALVSTADATVDATVETKLARLHEVVLAELAATRADG